jgi:hypothetical protein
MSGAPSVRRRSQFRAGDEGEFARQQIDASLRDFRRRAGTPSGMSRASLFAAAKLRLILGTSRSAVRLDALIVETFRLSPRHPVARRAWLIRGGIDASIFRNRMH